MSAEKFVPFLSAPCEVSAPFARDACQPSTHEPRMFGDSIVILRSRPVPEDKYK